MRIVTTEGLEDLDDPREPLLKSYRRRVLGPLRGTIQLPKEPLDLVRLLRRSWIGLILFRYIHRNERFRVRSFLYRSPLQAHRCNHEVYRSMF